MVSEWSFCEKSPGCTCRCTESGDVGRVQSAEIMHGAWRGGERCDCEPTVFLILPILPL